MSVWFEEAGTGRAVVLLHSTAADARMWDEVWEPLAARFRVIRLDFRGYGRSPLVADKPYSNAGDVADLLDRLGVATAAVVGSSGGGRVALELATVRPDLVSELVLIAAAAGLPPSPELAAFGDEEDRLLEAGDVTGAAELNARTWLGPDADERAHAKLVEMQRNAFEIQLAADPEPEVTRPEVDLTAITAPALVVIGGQDLADFATTGRHLVAEMPSATLLELPWAGHLPAMERPAEIATLLIDRLG
ncbi:alpha/beta hydrolase [Acrocarpospora phusangensis]|uniref:Alpha/beta hydrolase n=1 Tax=Acrocarpospora phusangensis TaxID=1070424 RepID=A0A919QIA4_9ACTN|nr:alpha/beta hydrolase [Acrocarpospora phusangensis]GIH26712.1 alpha/beta hydrolase [Acrocarpospora phusangensis]